MSETEASVRIVADASGVRPGVDKAKGEIGELAPMLAQLNASMQDMAAGMRSGFAEVAAQLAATKNEMASVEAATEKEGLTLQAVAARAKEAALQVHEGVESFNSFKGAIREAAEAYLAFFAVERIKEWATELGEAAEQVHHLQQQFGLSTAQVQELKGIADGTGVPIEKIVKGMAMLDREAERSPEKFQKLGIEIKAGASQMDILMATAERFGQYSDGPTKVAAAMELMHRSGLEMIPVFDRGADGLQELITKAQEYGVVNEQAQASGMALAESVNESKLAWDGLKQTLTQAFGPVLTEIVDSFNDLVKSMTESYREGGVWKGVFDTIVQAIEGFGEIFDSVGDAVSDIFKAMGASAGDWRSFVSDAINVVVGGTKGLIAAFVGVVMEVGAAFDDIRGYLTTFDAVLREKLSTAGLRIEELKIVFQSLGVVINDVMSFRWGSIAADWDAGMNRLATVAKDGAAKIKTAFQDGLKQAAGYHKEGADVQAEYQRWLKTFMAGPHAAPKRTGEEGGGGEGGDAPNIGKQQKGKKDKGPSQLDQWKAELAEKLAAEENWNADDKALTLAFWQDKLSQAAAGSKEELEVRREVSKAKLAVLKEEQQESIAGIKQVEALSIDVAKTDIALARQGLQDKLTLINQEESQRLISGAKAASMRADVNRQLYQLDLEEEDREYAAKERALKDQLNLELLKPAQRDAINRQLELLDQQHLDREKVLRAQNASKEQQDAQKALTARQQMELTAANSVASSWGSALGKMLTLQQGFAATLKGLYQGLQSAIGNALSQIIDQWIAEHLAALLGIGTSSKAGAAGQIADNAGVAGSAAYAAIAGIPIVGPELAPEAAATAAAGALAFTSFLSVPSGAGGIWDVAGGLTMLHEKEMVLPAWAAQPLRSMIGGGAANTNAPVAASGNGGGDTHYNFTFPGQVITNPGDLQRWARSNAPALASGLKPHIEKWHKPGG